MPDEKIAWGYIRVSTSKQDVDVQLHYLEEFARMKGFSKFVPFVDKGQTGYKNPKRKGLNALFDAIKSSPERIDAVLVYKLDRIARSSKEVINLVETLQDLNVQFISLNDAGYDTTTPTGRFILNILAAAIELDYMTLTKRLKDGRDYAINVKGVKLGRPLGKTSKKNGGKFIDSKQVLELKYKGLSNRAIAKTMGCSKTPIDRIINEQWQPVKTVAVLKNTLEDSYKKIGD